MVNSDIDPVRRPSGYRDLELALREQTRLLRALGGSIPVEDHPRVTALEITTSSATKCSDFYRPRLSEITMRPVIEQVTTQ
jgi:hypothetical protein